MLLDSTVPIPEGRSLQAHIRALPTATLSPLAERLLRKRNLDGWRYNLPKPFRSMCPSELPLMLQQSRGCHGGSSCGWHVKGQSRRFARIGRSLDAQLLISFIKATTMTLQTTSLTPPMDRRQVRSFVS